jgi:hypothetical protein
MRIPMLIAGILITILYKIGCDSIDHGIVDPSNNSPYILSMTIDPDTINTDTVFVGGQSSPDDELELTWDINLLLDQRESGNFSIHYTLTGARSGQRIADDLFIPSLDATPDTAEISFPVTAKIIRSDIGKFIFETSAITETGLSSNSRLATVDLIRTNSPPIILAVTAPDTLELPDPVNGEPVDKLFEISVSADDPDGTDDVTSVFFYSYNPAGQKSTAPFYLKQRESGLFVDTLRVNSNNAKGTYRFEFQALDRSNTASDTLNHYITLK